MERIFAYIAAILSRVLFSLHVGMTIWWVTLVTNDHNLWYIMAIYSSCLLLETCITVLYRKGHEYYWFCPSIFIFTVVEIWCFSILRMKLGECWRTNSNEDGVIRCSTNVSRPGIEEQIDNFGLSALVTDDEKIISGLDQTFLLLLVIGRWLLPKGQMSRDQLSQLLFIYIAAAADIVELTEIYDVRAVLANESMTNLVIALWSLSLFQFSVTIQNAETIAQERDIAEVKLEKKKEKERNGETIEITTGRSNRIAPALYTYKLAQRKAMERQRERRSTMDLNSLARTSTQENSPTPPTSRTKTGISRVLKALARFEETVQSFIRTYIDLIQLITPMLLQDGPFLLLRLYIALKYDVSDSNMFLFLIAKNALVILLQIYRICVLYCKPTDREEPEEDIFHEPEAARLRNVQTALASVGTATLTIHAAVPPVKAKRKRSRAFSLAFVNKIALVKRKRESTSSKGQTSRQEISDEDGVGPEVAATENDIA